MTSQEATILVYDAKLTNAERGQLAGMLDACARAAKEESLVAEWDHWKEPISLAIRQALQARGFGCYAANNIFRVTWGLDVLSEEMKLSEKQFVRAGEAYRKRYPDAEPAYQSRKY